MNKSALFTAYNAARRLDLDRSRLNKALGLVQLKDGQRTTYYFTTPDCCTCPDAKYRKQICKHRIAAALVAAAEGMIAA